MSSQVDLGVRVFLLDNLSSPMGLVNLSLATMGSLLLGLADKSDVLASQFSAAMWSGNYTQAAAFADELEKVGTAMTGLEIAAGAGVDLAFFASTLETATHDAEDIQVAFQNMTVSIQDPTNAMHALQDQVVSAANSSIFSVNDLASAMDELGMKGLQAGDLLKYDVADTVSHLAEVMRTDASTAADTLGSVMEHYGLTAKDAASTSDLLSYAFLHSGYSASQLQTAFETVASRAAMLHIPMDQLVVSLDALGRAGLTAGTASAGLNYYLQALTSPVDHSLKEFGDLGIMVVNSTVPAFSQLEHQLKAAGASFPTSDTYTHSVEGLKAMFVQAQKLGIVSPDKNFFQWAQALGLLNNKLVDAKGHFIGLVPSLDMIAQKIKGMPQNQQMAALEAIFNVKSGTSATVLLNNLSKLDSQLKSLKASQDAKGLTDQKAAQTTDTLASKMKELQTTFTDFLGLGLLPIVKWITPLVGGFTNFLSSLMKTNPGLMTAFGVFLIAGTAISAVVLIVGLLITAFALLSPVLLPIIGTVALVSIGIAALAAAIGGAVVFVRSHMSFFGPFFKGMQDLFNMLWKVFVTGLSPALGSLGKQWNLLLNSVKPLLPVLAVLGAVIGALLSGALHGLIAIIPPLAAGIIMVLGGAFRFLAGVFEVIIGLVKFVAIPFIMLFDLLFNGGKNTQALFQQWQLAMFSVFMGVIHMLQGLGQIAIGVFFGVFGAVGGFIFGFIYGIISFFQHLFDALVGHSIIPDLVNGILNWFKNLASIPGNLLNTVITPIKNLFDGLVKNALDWGSNLIKMLGQGITNGIHWVQDAVGNVGHAISNVLGIHSPAREGPLADSDTWMPNLMHMFVTGIVGGTTQVRSAASGAAGAIHAGFTSPTISSLQSAGGGLGGGGNSTINLNMDGKPVTQLVLNRLTGQLQMNGAARLFR